MSETYNISSHLKNLSVVENVCIAGIDRSSRKEIVSPLFAKLVLADCNFFSLTFLISQSIVSTMYHSPSSGSILGFIPGCCSWEYGSVRKNPYEDCVCLIGPFSLSKARRTAPWATAISLLDSWAMSSFNVIFYLRFIWGHATSQS
jgi:hypothetical protein